MTDHLKVYAGLSIGDDCPIRFYPVHDSDDIAFVYGGGGLSDDVEIVYSRAALATMLTLASRALT